MTNLTFDKRTLRKFAVTMAASFFVISAAIYLKHRHPPIVLSVITSAFLLLGALKPEFLKWVYVSWMKLAQVLSWLNTRILLVAVFYLIFTPIGLVLRIFGKDLLDRKIEKKKESYWRNKDLENFSSEEYERQF